MNEIVKQAHHGSVAAIIQVLNEKLANSGVRTRAIFADGVLQLLCEAAKVEQLTQSTLVADIRQILESIAPRNIRRVNINSRIVREQQLLWLEEIHRGPENQLLWSEEITLAQPNPFRQLAGYLRTHQNDASIPVLPKPPTSRRPIRKKRQLWRGIVGGATLCVFLLLVGWTMRGWLNLSSQALLQEFMAKLTSESNTKNQKTLATLPTPTAQNRTHPSIEDPFAAAVRIANQAALIGKTAQSSAEWLDIAAKWQRASDLMKAVPVNHSRYQEAQIRTKLYRKYSEAAQQAAQKQTSS